MLREMKSRSALNGKKMPTSKKVTNKTIDTKVDKRKNVALTQPLIQQLPIQKLHRNRTAFTENQLHALENGLFKLLSFNVN